MKNMFKSNKKGFTLVELLAVIVILALLIVITANTVLPMMNKSKKTGMITYAERVLANAATSFQADDMTAPVATNAGRGYSIEEIMGNDSYFGCVYVTKTSSTQFKYDVVMYSSSDNLQFVADTTEALFSGEVDTLVKEYTGTRVARTTTTGTGDSAVTTNNFDKTACNVTPVKSGSSANLYIGQK